MPKMAPINLARYNKLWVAAVTFAGALISNQVITGRNADIVSAVIGAVGVLGVFAVPNSASLPAGKHRNPVEPDPNANIKAGLGYPPVKPLRPVEGHNVTATRRPGKYGRQPKKVDPRTLQFGHYVMPGIAAATLPASVNWTAKVTRPYGMLLNDSIGDCTVAAKAHLFMVQAAAASGTQLSFTDAQALAAYEAEVGYKPNDPNTDTGASMLDSLNFARKTGVGGHKVGAYAEIQPKAHDHVKLGVYLFGAVDCGFDIPDTAETQFERGQAWSYVKGARVVGGHDVPIVAYNPTGPVCITWGQTQQMTWDFFDRYCTEAYGCLDPDWFSAGKSPEGFDLAALTADLKSLPGSSPVVVPTPQPDPTPTPTPEPPVPPVIVPPNPATPDDQHLWALVSTWTEGGHGSTTRAVATALKEWAKAKQLT